MKGYEITTWLCEGCLPDELEGIEPMPPDEAKGYGCERCGRVFGTDDAERERPHES